MLRSRFVRNYLLGTLSVLGGLGIAWLVVINVGWSEDAQEFWFLIIAFAISISLKKLFDVILEKLIGKPEG
jgi:hypothetical protein